MKSSAPALAIGPANYAEQGYAWAHAVRDTLGVRADSFGLRLLKPTALTFRADRPIPTPLFFMPAARRLRMLSFLHGYTHVALDGFITFFQLPRYRDVGADARFLAKHGFEMAFIAHGSDVRSPSSHLARNKWSYFREADDAWVSARAAQTERSLRVATTFGYPVFCSTPDLMLDIPSSMWLPLVINPDEWSTDQPVMERAVPRVLHIPSRRVPPIKGTQYIDPILRKLEAKGLVEYVSPEKVAHGEMADLMASCDIVIDQLLTSSYGRTSVEAMASGRVTVCYISDEVRAAMPAELPIVEANPDTLEEVLIGLVEERSRARDTAAQSVRFVRRWHDGRESANRLAGFLGVSPASD